MNQRIESRRQLAIRIGATALFLGGFLLEASACIFDKGDFKEGGRLEHAATSQAQNQNPTDVLNDDDDGTSGGTSGAAASSGTSGATSTSGTAGQVDAGDGGTAQ